MPVDGCVPKEENTHMRTGTCGLCYTYEEIKNPALHKSPRHNRHVHLFISAMRRWDESGKVGEKPQRCHDVSPTLDV